MNYWRCKCGTREAWESGMFPPGCITCDECGSTLGMSPTTHREPQPHDWQTKYDEHTGKPYRQCSRCHEREEADPDAR